MSGADAGPDPERDRGRGVEHWLAPLVLLLGLAALWAAGHASGPPPEVEGMGPSIVDPPTAWRLRRIALAISTPRLEQVDSFLSFPGTVDVVDLPVYDEVLALAARAVTAGRVGGPGGGVDVELLEHVALGFAPLVGVLGLLALYAALRQTLTASRASVAGACLFVGAGPAWLEAARSGVLRIELLAALAALVGLRVLLAVFRSRSPVDRFTSAMVAGAAFGFGLATTPLFLLPVAAAWFAFLREALSASEEERDDVGRTFLLFWITVSLGGLLPSLGGPWLPAEDGLVRGWTRLVVELALLGAAPFVGLRFAPRWTAALLGGARGVLAPAAVLVLALALLHALGPDHARTALLSAALGWGADGVQGGPGALELAGLLAWALAGAGLLRRPRGERWAVLPGGAERDLLLATSLLCGIATLVHPPVLALAALPVAVGAAAWLEDPVTRRRAAWGAAGSGLLLVAGTVALARDETAGPGLQAARVGRALREAEPEPRGWHSVRAVQRAGVLCAPELAPLVAWHARLPCATLGAARNGDPSGRHALRGLLGAESPTEVLRRARRGRLGYLVLGPGGLDGPGLESLSRASAEPLPGVRRVTVGSTRILVLEPLP